MRKIALIFLTILLLANTTFTVNPVRADEFDEGATEEVVLKQEEVEEEMTEEIIEEDEEPVIESCEEPKLNNGDDQEVISSVVQAENGDLIFTFADGEWLIDFNQSSNGSLIIHGIVKGTDVTIGYYDHGSSNNYPGESYVVNTSNNTVTVPYWGIMAAGIPAGDIYYDFSAYGTELAHVYGTTTITQGAAFAPEFTISENKTTGDIEISCSDEDFIDALLQVNKFDDDGQKYQSGAEIIIEDEKTSHIFCNREYTDILKSEDGTKAYIKNSDIVSQEIVNNSSDVNDCYEVKLHVPGYAFTAKSQVRITMANAEFDPSDDPAFSIGLNNDGDLIVVSSNNDWLEAIAEPSIYDITDRRHEIIKEGGSLWLSLADSNDRTYLENIEFVGGSNPVNIIEYNESDTQGVNSYIRIDRDFILSFDDIVEGDYTVGIEPYKYLGYTHSETIHIDVAEPAVFISNIEQVENGDIKIYFSDATYLSYVNKDSFHLDLNKEGFGVGLWFDWYGDTEFEECFEIIDNQYVLIPYENLLANGIPAGEYTVAVTIKIDEKELCNEANVTLTKAAKALPEYSISEDAEGNINIVSADTDFIKAVAKAFVFDNRGDNGRTASSGSSVRFMDIESGNIVLSFENQQEYWSDGNYSDTNIIVSLDGCSAVIPAQKILSNGLANNSSNPEDSNYYYNVCADVYGYVHETKQIHLEHACNVINGEFDVDFDEDGNMIITSEDNEWLETLARPRVYYQTESNNSETYSWGSSIYLAADQEGMENFYINNEETYDAGGHNRLWYNTRYRYIVPEGESEDPYIFVPGKILSSSGVVDGDYFIYLNVYGYVGVCYPEGEEPYHLEGYCADAPSDVAIYQDETTYDVYVSSNNRKYIEELCSVYDEKNNEYTYETSRFEIEREQDNYCWIHNFANNDGTQINLEFVEGEGENEGTYYAKWSYDQIVFEKYAIRKYPVNFHVCGFENISRELDLVYGAKEFPAEMLTELNSDKDLVFTIPDEDLLNALMQRVEDGENPSIEIYDEDWSYWFDKDTYEVDVENGTLIIRNADLRYNGITGIQNIRMCAPGYIDCYIYGFNFNNGIKAVPKDLKVSQDSNGNLIIKTSDTKYLNALMKPCVEGEGYFERFSGVEYGLYKEEWNGYDFFGYTIENYVQRNNDQEDHYENHMTLSKTTLTISRDTLIDSLWLSGDKNQIAVHADGYKVARIYNVELNNLLTDEMPSEDDFSVAYVAGTGLVITCDDEDYLAGMVNMDYFRYDSARVQIESGEGDDYEIRFLANHDTAEGYHMNYYVSGNTVVVPEMVLIENELEEKDVTVALISRGYMYHWVSDETVSIPHLKKDVPEDVAVSFNEWGDLIVTTEDSDYLEALAKQYNYVNAKAGEAAGGIIGIGDFDEENPYNYENVYIYSNYYGDDFFAIISEDGYVEIFSSILKSEITESGNYDIVLDAAGYEITHFNTYVYVITPRASEFGYCMYPGQQIDFDFESDTAVTWKVGCADGGEEILAEVDENGVVTAYKTGAIIVNAIDAEGNADTLYVEITEYEPEGVLSAILKDVDINGFEKDDKAEVEVQDNGEVVNPYMFDYVSSDETIVSVNGEAEVTAVGKGTATITVLFGGTERVATTVKVTVIDRQVDSVTVYSKDYEEETNGIYISSDVSSIQLSASGKDKLDKDTDVSNLTYVSSDTAVATVDKNGLVAIRKAGQFTITATTTTNAKSKGQVSDSVVIRVLDYTPVLESDKLTVNRYYTAGSFLGIYAKYVNDEVHGSSIKSVGFEGTKFTAVYNSETDKINIKFNGTDADKNQTYTEKLNVSVTTPKGTVNYSFDVKITLTSTLPAATVKAAGTYNTFTRENSLKFTATVKDATVDHVEFEDDFAEVDAGDNVTIKGNVYKGNALIYVTGYSAPVVKPVTFKTVSTAPKITADTTSVTLFVPDTAEAEETKSVVVHLKDASKNIIKEGIVAAEGGNHPVSMDEDGNITLTVPATGKGGTYKFSYRDSSWAEKLVYSVKVTINNKIPTAKLETSVVTLNTHFDRDNETVITTSSGDRITKAAITYAGKGSAPERLTVNFDAETQKITAETDGSVEIGTYVFNIVPTITVDDADHDLKAVNVSVKVEDTVPAVTFKSTAAKFNKALGKGVLEDAVTTYTVKNNPYDIDITKCSFKELKKVGKDYEVIDTEKEGETFIDGNFVDNQFSYVGISSDIGKKEVYIQFIFEDLDGNDVEGNIIRFTLTFYQAEPKAAISLKGNLNQIDMDGEVVGTVKYTNLVDTVKSAELEGANKDNFSVDVTTDGKLIFKLTEAGRRLTDGAYNVNVKLTSEIGAVTTTAVSIKLARKAPTLKLAASTVNVYDMTSIGAAVARVKLNQTGNGEIVKPVWTSSSFGYELKLEGDEIVVYLKDAAKIKAGSTSKFTIKIDWVGDYGTYAANTKSLKTTTLTLNVKDASGGVKAK